MTLCGTQPNMLRISLPVSPQPPDPSIYPTHTSHTTTITICSDVVCFISTLHGG